MSITEKTLKKWRRESLQGRIPGFKIGPQPDVTLNTPQAYVILHERILRLTQELMDQKLKEGR